MKKKYLIPAISSAIITAIIFVVFIYNISDDNLIFVTLPLLMFSGVITVLFTVWATKPLLYKYLDNYGFNVDETLISLLQKISLNSLLSRRASIPVYTLAFYIQGEYLRVAEIAPYLKNSVNVLNLPITNIKKFVFETNLDTTACFIIVEGLSGQLSPDFRQAHSDYYLFSPANPDKFKVSDAVRSRNEFDTVKTIELIQNLTRKYSIPLEDNRK